MNRRKVLNIALIAVALLVCFNMCRTMFWMPAIASHHGDSVFEDFSRRAWPFAMPGYCIKMPEFDLANPQEAEYRFGGLTNIGTKCSVHLAIRDHDDRWFWRDRRELDGRVQLELLDSKGLPVVSVGGRLGDYIWMGVNDLYALYLMDKSFFTPDSGEEYRLRVSYDADPKLAGSKGFVYVRCVRSM